MSQHESEPAKVSADGARLERGTGRRRFFTAVSALGSLAIGALVAVPGIAYLADPLLRRRETKGRWIPVVGLDNLRDDKPVRLPVIGDLVDAWTRAPAQTLGNVWLQKRGDRVLALAAECPHLGCQIGYDEPRTQFACPCHESAFTEDGLVQSGPSPRHMDELESRVVNGKVEIRFLRYRSQTEDKVILG